MYQPAQTKSLSHTVSRPFSRRYHTHDFHPPPPFPTFRDAQHGHGRALAQCLDLGAYHPMLHYGGYMSLFRPRECVQYLQGLCRELPAEKATGNGNAWETT